MDIGLILRAAAAVAICAVGAPFAFALMRDGLHPLASMVIGLTVFAALVLLKKGLSPWRWLATGIALALLFTVFPILYTVFLSFTNMSSGHLLTKQQSVATLAAQVYVPAGAAQYSWKAYSKGDGEYLVLFTDAEGRAFVATPGSALEAYELQGEPPEELRGYAALDPVRSLQEIQRLSELRFGTPPEIVAILDPGSAAPVVPAQRYDAANDSFVDAATGAVYRAKGGSWVSDAGALLAPGFVDGNGTENYERFLGNEGYRRPLVGMIAWNIAFAALSVLFSFALGLMIALAFERLPGKRLIRSLLIVPYPIPVLVSIMVWRALLNEDMGLVTQTLQALFGASPKFFTDVLASQAAVVLINVYLSYPYFYILSSGALKAIPSELYEAADIDGAGPFQALTRITLPLSLRILSPLLIASFCFNFNNFTIIWGFNSGNPPMTDTIVPMGHTDLLVSFIYRLGFNAAGAADYGFSAAITVLLFVFVGLMVFLQTWNTRTIKEA